MQRPRIIPNHTDSNGWWETLAPPLVSSPLSQAIRVETAIIGAGICGVATAHQLGKLKPDSEIALIEAEKIGYGASGRNAGFLLNLHSHGPPKKLEILKRNMQFWESGLSDLRRMVREFQIDCDWHEYGRIYGAAGPDGERHIDEIAHTLDMLELDHAWLDQSQMQQQIGTGFYNRGLRTFGSVLVNPAAMMRGLARNLPSNVRLFEETPATEIEKTVDGYVILTPKGRIQADQVVLAAGAFMKEFGVGSGRYVPMATYASLTAPLDETELACIGSGEPFGLLGASENGATIRLTNDNRLFVRNVYHHAPGSPSDSAAVAKIAKQHHKAMVARWPDLQHISFEHSWGGTMAFTWNNGAVFGQMKPGLFAVLTNDVSPMTRGAAAGRLLADYMEQQDSALLHEQLQIPEASRLPPRPFLDLGIAWHRTKLNALARKEF